MGHTKPEHLADLQKEFEILRGFESLQEKKPGIFYYKSTSFLHFHDKDGSRWADVKTPDGKWQRLDIDFKASATAKTKFLKAAGQAHAALLLTRKK